MTFGTSNLKKLSATARILWVVYFLDFIFSGIVRGLLPGIISNVLYFARGVVVVILFLLFLNSGKVLNSFSRFFVFLAFLLFGFQLVLLINSELNLINFFYGLYLYVIPLIGVAMSETIDLRLILLNYFLILRIALPINFLVCVLQTVFNFAPLYSAGFGTGLYSSNGIQRATGTFSSSVGFSLFLSLSLIILIGLQLLDLKVVPIHMWLIILFLVLVSGSRTTIFNVGYLLVLTYFMKGIKLHVYSKRIFSRVFWGLLLLFSVTFPLVSSVYYAGLYRFTSANEIDPPISRLLFQLSLENHEFRLFGEGLGTRALGSVNNSDRRILFAEWIEFDNARILVEAGVIFLVLIWFAKILFVFNVINARTKLSRGERTFLNVGLVGLMPYLLFAQIFGQATLSGGVFLLMYLLLSLFNGAMYSNRNMKKL